MDLIIIDIIYTCKGCAHVVPYTISSDNKGHDGGENAASMQIFVSHSDDGGEPAVVSPPAAPSERPWRHVIVPRSSCRHCNPSGFAADVGRRSWSPPPYGTTHEADDDPFSSASAAMMNADDDIENEILSPRPQLEGRLRVMTNLPPENPPRGDDGEEMTLETPLLVLTPPSTEQRTFATFLETMVTAMDRTRLMAPSFDQDGPVLLS